MRTDFNRKKDIIMKFIFKRWKLWILHTHMAVIWIIENYNIVWLLNDHVLFSETKWNLEENSIINSYTILYILKFTWSFYKSNSKHNGGHQCYYWGDCSNFHRVSFKSSQSQLLFLPLSSLSVCLPVSKNV